MQAVAGPSSGRPLAERNLLEHVNKIRQAPSLVSFETVLRSTGDDWLELMVQQAEHIRGKWVMEYEANSSRQHAASAGEMLKTPSRKRATARARVASKATTKATSVANGNPFLDNENKENAPAQVAAAKNAAAAVGEAAGVVRSTRSRTDRSQMAKLPNPFQPKAQSASNKSTDFVQSTDAGSEEDAQVGGVETALDLTKDDKLVEPKVASKPAKVSTAKKSTTENAKQSAADAKAAPAERQLERQQALDIPITEPVRDRGKQGASVDDSMEVEGMFGEPSPLKSRPLASTPTGKRSATSARNRLAFSDEALDPIADAAESENETFASPGSNKDDQESHASSSVLSEQAIAARDAEAESEPTTVALQALEATDLPRQKRTLASFGGTKKSMGYAIQHTPGPATTPAASQAFKSSFLTKSLQQASMRKTDGSQEMEDSQEVTVDQGSTKANTEANAAAMVGTKVAQPKEATSEMTDRVIGTKRKSEEMVPAAIEDADPRKTVKAPSTLSRNGQPAPPKAAQQDQLLRSRLQSARSQKPSGANAAGPNTAGQRSPVLHRTGLPSRPASPESKAATQRQEGRAPVRPPLPHSSSSNSSNVSRLRDRWEAQSSTARASPRKSRETPVLPPKSPSRLPVPVSTTPQGTPTRRGLLMLGGNNAKIPLPADQGTSKQPVKDLQQAGAHRPSEENPASEPAREDQTLQSSPKALRSSEEASAFVEAEGMKSPAGASAAEPAFDSEASTQDDGEDADDESEQDDVESHLAGDGQTTKITRPLSAAQVHLAQESLSHQSASRLQGFGEDTEANSSVDIDLTADGPKEKKAVSTASAATQTLASAKPSNVPNSATTEAPAPRDEVSSQPGHGQGNAWSTRLKGLFGIAAMPGAIVGSTNPQGSGFQPNKLNRSVSSASKDSNPGSAATESSTLSNAPVRTSAIGTNNGGKPASLIRAEQLRRKEAEDAERRNKEREEKRNVPAGGKAAPSGPLAPQQQQKAKGNAEAEGKKRMREDGEPLTQAGVSKPGQNGKGNTIAALIRPKTVAPNTAAGTHLAGQSNKIVRPAAATAASAADGKRRRLSEEQDDGHKGTSASTKPTQTISRPASALKGPMSNGINRPQPVPSSVRPTAAKMANGPATVNRTVASKAGAPGKSNFTQANPFQQSSGPTRPTATTVSHQPPRSQPPPSHVVKSQASRMSASTAMPSASGSGTVLPNLDDDNVSLPSIVSEYSDSEDEETQARRARAADWTKGDALQRALQAQSEMDADRIFGVPTGNVDLETLMPPQDHAAKMRMGRPRSSSANWSGPDALAQWEIDQYNKRMNITGPGFKLPARSGSAAPAIAAGASGTSSTSGRLGPNGQQHRQSVLAIGAAAAARQQQQQQQRH